MPVDPTVPADSALVSASAAQLRANFLAVNVEFGSDHYEDTIPNIPPQLPVPYDIATNAAKGKHRQVRMVRLTTDGPAMGVDEGMVYAKQVGAVTQLFYKTNALPVQLTGPLTDAANGSITLPGGIILKWGSVSVNNGTFQDITFQGGAFTSLYSISASYSSVDNGLQETPYILGTPVVTGFRFRNATGHVFMCRYIAIGK